MESLYPKLFEILWFASLPCSNLNEINKEFLINYCDLAGKQIDCSKIFQKIPTDSGMCCALNTKDALKFSNYASLVRKMQNSTESSEKESILSKVGMQNGLKILLDLHSNTESFGFISNDFNAFRIFIGESTQFPAPKERSILIQPGKEHFLDMSSQLFTSHGIENLSPAERRCYFHHEGSLEFYDYYTVSNCIFECGIKHAEVSMGCIPWYLPQGQNSTACDPWTAREFSTMLLSINNNSSHCKHCLPDCETTEYSVTTSAANFRSIHDIEKSCIL